MLIGMAEKKPLEPLIPLDDLKAVLAKIVAAPKVASQVDADRTDDVKKKGPRRSEALD
jgi:hypothetical protein